MIAVKSAAKIGLHGLIEAPWRVLVTLVLSACALGALGMSVSASSFDVRTAEEQVLFEDGYLVQGMGVMTAETAAEAERAAGHSLARVSGTTAFGDFTYYLGTQPRGNLDLTACLTQEPAYLMYADAEYLAGTGAEVIGRLPEREDELALSLCFVNSFLEFGYYDNIASPTVVENFELIRDEAYLTYFDSAEAFVSAGCRIKGTFGFGEEAEERVYTIVGAVDEHCTHDHRTAGYMQRIEPYDKVYMSLEAFTGRSLFSNGTAWNCLLAVKGETPEALGDFVAFVQGREDMYFVSELLSALETCAESLEQASTIFGYVGLGLIVFAAALIYQFVTFSMEKKKRQIGVLRALGASRGDIAFIFLMESLFLALLQAALGAGLSFVFGAVTNVTLQSGIALPITFVSIRLWTVPALFGLSILVSLLAAALPIAKTVKKSPVEAIRDNEE